MAQIKRSFGKPFSKKAPKMGLILKPRNENVMGKALCLTGGKKFK